MTARGALVALTALVLIPAAAAQVFVEPETADLALTPGEASTLEITLTNPTNRSYFIVAAPGANLSAATTLEPSRFALGPVRITTVLATVTPPAKTEFVAGELRLRFTIVDRETGSAFERNLPVQMTLVRAPLLLGIFDNPLPAPFDGGWAMWVIEVLAWALGAFALVAVMSQVVLLVAPRATGRQRTKMARLVRVPIWYLIVVLGINYSWRLVPRSAFVDVVDALNNSVAVIVAGLFFFKVTQAGFYYVGEKAKKTETKVDDLVIPVVQKLSAVVIVIATILWSLSILGVDLSFLVAGGLVAGLVISFAAQDTLSNFFSGIFILVDRPFRVGDDILLETGEICRVDRIGLRSCTLYNYTQHLQIIIPNNDLGTKRVSNLAYPDVYYRLILEVGVAYGTDLRKAVEIATGVMRSTSEVVVDDAYPLRVYVRRFADSAIDLELRAYLTHPKIRDQARTDISIGIHEAFAKAGIEIPFPQRVLHMSREDAGRLAADR